jgi:S1-C subfamily serine protease
MGEVDLRIEWSVFSRLERRTVYRTQTFGRAASGRPRFSGGLMLIEEAIAHAMERLAADTGFRSLIYPSNSAPIELLSGPVHRPLVGRDLPENSLPLSLEQIDEQIDSRTTESASGGEFPQGPHALLFFPRLRQETRPVAEEAGRVLQASVMVSGGAGHGSGFFLAAAGTGAWVITSAHVVGDAERVRVLPAHGPARTGQVLRRHLARDVALVRVDGPPVAVLPIRQAPARIGEPVYVVGAPLQERFHHTLTSGILSRFSRDRETGLPLIQSDAAVYPGTSGGPLVDAAGNLLGLAARVVGGESGGIGLNGFIPIQDALAKLGMRQQKGES